MSKEGYQVLFDRIMAKKRLDVGRTNDLIAEVLGISPNTVRDYKNKGIPAISLKFLKVHFKI